VLRADSGFCREELMGWCERNHVDYLFGLARNKRLLKIIGAQMHQAHILHQSSGKAVRVFAEFSYQTHKSWSCARRVVAKAEYLDKGENPRFVVTSLTAERSLMTFSQRSWPSCIAFGCSWRNLIALHLSRPLR